jgi:glycosyltransferase involved in cell wall biosynthesis
MNILFVQPALPHYRVPFFTELQRRSHGQLQVWSDHRHPLVPFCDPNGEFGAVHCPEIALGPLLSQPAMFRAVRSTDTDVVVLPWNSRYLQLSPALLEARWRRKPVVLWGHGYSKQFVSWKHRARNAIGKLANACVTYSESTRQRLISEGLAPSQVFSAPNALDGTPFQRERRYWLEKPGELEQLQRRLGIQPGKVVLFVSRLQPDKRVELLLEALRRLTPRTPNIQLVIVGAGSELERLQRRARQLDVAEQTLFLGALYDERLLGGVFASATVFAYPVAVGLSILHALHYGVPVVTSDNTAWHNPEFDVLVPGRNSLLFRDDNVDDLAAQLERLVCHPDLRARLSEGALASVSGADGRTLDRMADGMLEALHYAVSTAS